MLFTEIKKATRQEKGVAQSLSFSELKLPGVSGLLTPMDSLPQTSGECVPLTGCQSFVEKFEIKKK